jgi:hypothetical protein
MKAFSVFLYFIFVFVMNSQISGQSAHKVLIVDKVFDEAIKETSILRNEIRADKIGLEQINVKSSITVELAKTKNNLKILENSIKGVAVSNAFLERIQTASVILSERSNQEILKIEDVQQIKDLSTEIEIQTEAALTCTSVFESLKTTVNVRNNDGIVRDKFEIRFSRKGTPDIEQRFAGGKLATAQDSVIAGNYWFWAQDPTDSSRKGTRAPVELRCNGTLEHFVQAPQ